MTSGESCHRLAPHGAPSCCGGQRLSAYEQNTQQSPGLGRSTVWQLTHS